MHLPLVPCHLLFYVPTVPDGFAAEVDVPNIYEQNTRWLDLNPLNLIHPWHHNLCHTHRICLLNHQVLFCLTICNHLFSAVCCHLLMNCNRLLLIYCYLLIICDHLLSIWHGNFDSAGLDLGVEDNNLDPGYVQSEFGDGLHEDAPFGAGMNNPHVPDPPHIMHTYHSELNSK